MKHTTAFVALVGIAGAASIPRPSINTPLTPSFSADVNIDPIASFAGERLINKREPAPRVRGGNSRVLQSKPVDNTPQPKPSNPPVSPPVSQAPAVSQPPAQVSQAPAVPDKFSVQTVPSPSVVSAAPSGSPASSFGKDLAIGAISGATDGVTGAVVNNLFPAGAGAGAGEAAALPTDEAAVGSSPPAINPDGQAPVVAKRHLHAGSHRSGTGTPSPDTNDIIKREPRRGGRGGGGSGGFSGPSRPPTRPVEPPKVDPPKPINPPKVDTPTPGNNVNNGGAKEFGKDLLIGVGDGATEGTVGAAADNAIAATFGVGQFSPTDQSAPASPAAAPAEQDAAVLAVRGLFNQGAGVGIAARSENDFQRGLVCVTSPCGEEEEKKKKKEKEKVFEFLQRVHHDEVVPPFPIGSSDFGLDDSSDFPSRPEDSFLQRRRFGLGGLGRGFGRSGLGRGGPNRADIAGEAGGFLGDLLGAGLASGEGEEIIEVSIPGPEPQTGGFLVDPTIPSQSESQELAQQEVRLEAPSAFVKRSPAESQAKKSGKKIGKKIGEEIKEADKKIKEEEQKKEQQQKAPVKAGAAGSVGAKGAGFYVGTTLAVTMIAGAFFSTL